MASKTVYLCDLCGAQKKEANHWWDIYLSDLFNLGEGVIIAPFDSEIRDPHITVCGQGCALKAVSQWMENGTLPFLKET